VDGLARLGVGVSDAAAEVLVAAVSRSGAPFFRYTRRLPTYMGFATVREREREERAFGVCVCVLA
jgi:hypothetical protein